MGVSVIIPAYNEEKYIGGVLSVLKEPPFITQILVVSDGSTDNTAKEAAAWGIEVLELEENIGKGGAMYAGLKEAREDVVLFLDADLIGLNSSHLTDLVLPILEDQADMTVGIFESGRLATDMAQFLAPFLSGQRCLRKEWLLQIEEISNTGFGVETALNHLAEQNNLRVMQVVMPGMSHVMKEEKLGLMRGLAYRLKMYWEIAKNVHTGGWGS